MSMNLDKRQRAMLREMGIRVWQPLPDLAVGPAAADQAVVPDQIAINTIADNAHPTSAKAGFDQKNAAATADQPPVAPAAKPPRPLAAPAADTVPASRAASASNDESPASYWGMAQAQLLYAATGADSEAAKTGARWLVLAEVPAATLQQALANPSAGFDALSGDAGKLLDNMLRAARLPSARSVHLVAIARDIRASASADLPSGNSSSSSSPVSLSSNLAAALPALIAAAQPDLLLVMGRFAGQALLQTDLPFGKLRGQAHKLLGKPVIVTCDAAYLLRQQLEKAKAWDDLRLAMSVAAGAGG